MKKLLFVLCIFFVSSGNAQRLIGVKAGLNINNYSNDFSSGLNNSKSLTSYHVGVVANLPFLIFSLQPGILIEGKGSEISFSDQLAGNSFISKSNPVYVEIPVTLNVNPRIGAKTGFYLGAGLYGATGIGGTNKVSGINKGVNFSHTNSIRFSDSPPSNPDMEEGAMYENLKKMDFGVTINAGVFLHGFMLSAFYDLGLSKINSIAANSDEQNYRNMTLGLSAGIFFGR